MPIPAVLVVGVGIGAATNLIQTGMVMHQSNKARKESQKMLEMFMAQNAQRRANLQAFLQQSPGMQQYANLV